MKKFLDSKISTYMLMALTFLSVLILCSFFVWTHDDFTVGSDLQSIGDIFEGSLFYGNGRFLGNSLVVICLQRPLLDKFVRATFITLIVWSSAYLTDDLKKRSLIISFLINLGLCTCILSQAVVWGHGFYNYVPPVSLLAISLAFLKRCYLDVKPKNCIFLSIILFITGFSQQLFSENSTTINFFLSFVILVAVLVKKQKLMPSLSFFLSSTIGAGCMFLLPKILKVSDKMDFYRGNYKGLSKIISNGFENFRLISVCLEKAFVFWAVLSIIISILMYCNKKKFKISIYILQVIFASFPVLSFLLCRDKVIAQSVVISILGVYALSILYVIIKSLSFKKSLPIFLFMIVALISAVQLLVVYPIGPRCLYITYFLMCLTLLQLSKETLQLCSKKAINNLCVFFSVLAISCYGVLTFIFYNIENVNKARFEYAFEQIREGRTCVEIIKLPYDQYMHQPNESYAYKYIFNLGSPEDMVFKYISYDEYLAKRQNK